MTTPTPPPASQPTPRTDALWNKLKQMMGSWRNDFDDMTDFARRLERELREMTSAHSVRCDEAEGLAAQLAAALKERDEAREAHRFAQIDHANAECEITALRAQLRTAEEAKGVLPHPGEQKCQRCGRIMAEHSETAVWECAQQPAPTPQKVPTGEGGDWLVATWQEEADAFRSWWEAHSSKLAHQATAAIAIAAFKAGRASGLSAPPATASAAQGDAP